ncbi:MAG: 50S ribosomal protein L32 [Candidatus Omnitrophota bacterium]
MAHPKRQHSNQRTRKRRTHDALKVSSLQPCANCGKAIISHRVCPFCGSYKGNTVIDMTPKEAKA